MPPSCADQEGQALVLYQEPLSAQIGAAFVLSHQPEVVDDVR